MDLLFVLSFFLVMTGVAAGRRSDYVTSISPHANTAWGSWGRREWCPFGHYAYGFQLKVEKRQGRRGDDTAANGIRLHCRSVCHKFGGDVTSSVQIWGGWGKSRYCPWDSFLKGVSMRSEPRQGKGDDTAVNNFEFLCQSIHRPHAIRTLTGYGMYWGHWSSPVHCPKKSYICGIRTKVEKRQRSGDDTALNDAIFYCCKLVQLKKCNGKM